MPVPNCRLVCEVIETNKRPGYALVIHGMITLPARGERHASARPTVLCCRHGREATISRPGYWTNYNFLLLYQPLSVTLPTRPQLFHSQKWACSDSGQRFFVLFFCFFLHGPLTAPFCSCTGCTANTYATVLTVANSTSKLKWGAMKSSYFEDEFDLLPGSCLLT